MIGKVVSTKMNKAAVVMVESHHQHPVYKRSVLHTKKYLADDALGVKEGDVVEIVKIRPISKRKHWKIEKVVGQDIEMIAKEELKEAAEEAVAEVMPEEKVEVEVVEESVVEEEKKPKKRAKKGEGK